MTEITTRTPVEIDTELAALYNDYYVLIFSDAARAKDNLHYAADDKRVYSGRSTTWALTTAEATAKAEAKAADESAMYHERESAKSALARYATVKAEIAANAAQQAPLHAEFTRRGGWTRAYLVVTKGQGHVHSSMHCSTCYPTTQFAWLPELSGSDETAIVEAAGERACTICYPTAPAEVLNRPTTLFTKDEVTKQREREERATAKAARQAEKVAKGLTPDGSEFTVRYVEQNAPGWERDEAGKSVHVSRDRDRTERFKTERAAVQWAVDALYRVTWSDAQPFKDALAGVEQVVAAVAAKHGKTCEEVRSDFDAKVAAKAKRDNR